MYETNFTRLKYFLLLPVLLVHSIGFAQLTNGGFHANFGVDADTKSDFIKYGAATGNIKSDDWFAMTGTSKGVIDTSNAAYYKTLLKNNENVSFVKGMSVPLYTKLSNTLMIDAVYCRDFIKADGAHIDSTAFVSACKNAADPATWTGGASSVSAKNDLLDVYTHMRRNGSTITDSLWLFTAASTTGTSGSRYYDIELFKNNLGYDRNNGVFSSGGPDEGHTQWKFDAAGNIKETGDMIIAITYNPGTAPVIELRIWVARAAFNTTTPALFNFNTSFDGNSNGSVYGYASIVSKAGNTSFGAGAGNYTATASDTTFSTPWGTTNTQWDANYQPLQLVEIGVNLTRIGLDPSLYAATRSQACGSFFKSIFYKSRSSASFSSNLNDFVGPLDFMKLPVMDHTIKTDTLSCKKPVGALKVTSNTTAALYQWKTPAGVTMSASSVAVNKPGVYILQSTIAAGCPVERTDSVLVLSDTLKPVASAAIAANSFGEVQVFGGDPVASNYTTPFGGSAGLAYNWSGPSSFTSTIQNPMVNAWGIYNVTVTELRNGCTSTATVAALLSILSDNNLFLTAKKLPAEVKLEWSHSYKEQVLLYDVERASPGKAFTRIATITNQTEAGNANAFTYSDQQPGPGNNVYRIKQINGAGRVSYSNMILIEADVAKMKQAYFKHNYFDGSWWLVIESTSAKPAVLCVYASNGRLITVQHLNLVKGLNTVQIETRQIENMQVKIGVVSDKQTVLYSSVFQ